jgi:hypothetical protein
VTDDERSAEARAIAERALGQLLAASAPTSEGLIVLLHAFRKTTAKLPTSEVDTAKVRWRDFQARMNTKPRRPPRAAGHDAP